MEKAARRFRAPEDGKAPGEKRLKQEPGCPSPQRVKARGPKDAGPGSAVKVRAAAAAADSGGVAPPGVLGRVPFSLPGPG